MTEALQSCCCAAGGHFARRILFGGLWWTVRKGVASERAALWFFGSMLLRTGAVMLGFYFVAGRQLAADAGRVCSASSSRA